MRGYQRSGTVAPRCALTPNKCHEKWYPLKRTAASHVVCLEGDQGRYPMLCPRTTSLSLQ